MVKKVNKILVFVKPLQNTIEINILEPETIQKFKHNPHVLLSLGIVDIFNVMHRISQKVVIDKIGEYEVKQFTKAVLYSLLVEIIKASVVSAENAVETGLEILSKEITDDDLVFLQQIGIKPTSLGGA